MLNNRFKNDGKPAIGLNAVQRKEVEIVKKKINTGVYQFEDVACPICGNKNSYDPISEKDRYGFYFPMQLCKECGLLMANPRLREVDYDDFYEAGHQKRAYVGESKPGTAYFNIQYAKGKSIYNITMQAFKPGNKISVLEVGCGAGGILKSYLEHGHDIKGIDLNPTYIEYGKKKHGLNLSTQNLFDIKNEKYDLIIYSHVLEHITNPNEHLEFIKSLLKKDGCVYIEVPGLRIAYKQAGGYLRYIQNAHVYNFTYTSLSNLMIKNGYVPTNKGNENIESLWQIGLSDNNLTNDYEASLKFLKKNERLLNRSFFLMKKKIKIYSRIIKKTIARK